MRTTGASPQHPSRTNADQPASPERVGAMPIADIAIGVRHRRDMGDIAGLAASIAEIGLLHPVVVQPDGTLIAGQRRIQAVESLGWTEVPVTIVNLDAVIRGEFAENIQRKDFTYAEAVAVKRALEPLEKAAAKERQREGGRCGGKASGKLPQASNGRAADKAAQATGKKRRTLEKAEQIVEAAEQNPERFADLAERLNEDDVRVDAVFRKLKQRRERAVYEARIEHGGTVADLHALAATGYRAHVICPDPPWPFETYSEEGKERAPERHFDTMPLDEIKALPVAKLAADDCALFLWATWFRLRDALAVIEAWGFEYQSAGFLWVKTQPGAECISLDGKGLHWGQGLTGPRTNTEVCLLATKGSPLRLTEDVHQVIIAPVGAHSEKPAEAYRRKLYTGPYLELFARKPRDGWTTWGNELPPPQAAPAKQTLPPEPPTDEDPLDIHPGLRRAAP